MVGKPNLPMDTEQREDVQGAARSTPGLSALDEEREASMADEGGTSGMSVESERNYRSSGDSAAEIDELAEPGLGFDLLLVGGVFAVGALAGILLTRVLGRD
jgi:hypothetical protein